MLKLEVLKGLNKTLLRSSPKLLVEVSAENGDEFEHYMNTLNYQCYTIADSESRRGNTICYYCWSEEGAYEVN